jgi:hypothetical protein
LTTLGIDEAWVRKAPAAIKKDGYSFVLGYLSTDASKNMTAARAKALHAAGLSVGVIWETTATRATAGYAAGRADRISAEKQANALGYPTSAALFWACDQQAKPSLVLPYARGWYQAGPRNRPTGPYGDKAVIEAVHAANLSSFEWQTEAWSGTAVSPQADLYQRVHTTRPSLGGGYDEDVLLHPVPLWGPALAPVSPTKPAPKPVAKPAANALPATPAARQALFIRLLLALLRKFGFKF